jgi:hypothetical protein
MDAECPDQAARRATQEHQLLHPKMRSHKLRELKRVVGQLMQADVTAACNSVSDKGTATAPLIPLDDREVLFPLEQPGVKWGVWRAWPTMQEQ